MLHSEVEDVGERTAVLRLEGEIDLSNADTIVDHFRAAAERGVNQVLVDATGITFVDSTGLHALIAGKRLLHESGDKIVLVPSPQLHRLLELTFPDPLFATRVATVQEAWAILEAEGL